MLILRLSECYWLAISQPEIIIESESVNIGHLVQIFIIGPNSLSQLLSKISNRSLNFLRIFFCATTPKCICIVYLHVWHPANKFLRSLYHYHSKTIAYFGQLPSKLYLCIVFVFNFVSVYLHVWHSETLSLGSFSWGLSKNIAHAWSIMNC